MRVDDNLWFVTDAQPRNELTMIEMKVAPGTGLCIEYRAQNKPAGAGSPFPYGVVVKSDRPRRYDV